MPRLHGYRDRVHKPLWDTLVGVTQSRVDFFVGIGPQATWLGSGDGAWSASEEDQNDGAPRDLARRATIGYGGYTWWIKTLERIADQKAFYRRETFAADVAGWLADTHNIGRMTAAPDDLALAIDVVCNPVGVLRKERWPWPDAPPELSVDWHDDGSKLDHRSAGTAFAWVPFDPLTWEVAKDAALQMDYDGIDGDHPAKPQRLAQLVEIFAEGGIQYEPELVTYGKPSGNGDTGTVPGLFWLYVENRITTPPPGRVLISRAGNEWHSLGFEIEHELKRIEKNETYDYSMGLRRLEDDEVVDLSYLRKASP